MGFDPDKIVFDSPCKTLAELRYAFETGACLCEGRPGLCSSGGAAPSVFAVRARAGPCMPCMCSSRAPALVLSGGVEPMNCALHQQSRKGKHLPACLPPPCLTQIIDPQACGSTWIISRSLAGRRPCCSSTPSG